MFSLGRKSQDASLQSWRPVIQSGRDVSPTEARGLDRIKAYNIVHCGNLGLCAVLRQRPREVRYQYGNWLVARRFGRSSTAEPVLSDFTQLDDLQAAVFQFEVVVVFEEVAVIC